MPQLERTHLASDACTWEAEYSDGTVDRENENKKYGQLKRSTLKKFRIVNPSGEVLFEVQPPAGANGDGLIFRKRTAIVGPNNGRQVLFIVGWAPNGPAYAIDVENGTYRVNAAGFDGSDSDFEVPQAMPGESATMINSLRNR